MEERPPNSRTGDKGAASPCVCEAVGTGKAGANGLPDGAPLGRVLAVENDAVDGRTF